MTLGEKIHNRRKEMGLSIADVAKYVGVSSATVSRWENGIIQNARTDKIEKLAILLHLNPIDLALSIIPDYDGPMLSAEESFGDIGTVVPRNMRVLRKVEISKDEYDLLQAYRNAPDNIKQLVDLALNPYTQK